MTPSSRLLLARGLRGFVDGLTSIMLAPHLLHLGFSLVQVGVITTAMLLGSSAVTMLAGLASARFGGRRILLAAGLLMTATGISFATVDGFWVLLIVAVLGTINPTGGDVSLFLPMEQALLAGVPRDAAGRAALYARYNVVGALSAAAGAAASIIFDRAGHLPALAAIGPGKLAFAFYAAFGLPHLLLYRGLPLDHALAGQAAPRPLARSRGVVLRLSALFSLDSFGGGFALQALLVVWLSQRFGMSASTAGGVLAAAGLLAGLSQFVSARLARRIGLVRTMVFTHLPANFFLVLAGLVPNAPLAITFLLIRSFLSQMDVPARQALVMSLVPPEERAAAASVTNVPRSLAGAISPMFAGVLLSATSVGWPLVIGGVLKAVYDLLLLAQFRSVERGSA